MKQSDYIKIYNWMRTIKCGVQRELYALLYSLGGDKDGASCTIQYLADRLNITSRWVQKTLIELQQDGYVTVEYVAGKRSIFHTPTPERSFTPEQSFTPTPEQSFTPDSLLYSDKSIKIKEERDNNAHARESEKTDAQPKTKKFQKPTAAEVQAYCDERANGISGEEFCDFYESKGWVIGKAPMKDWRAAVRTWEQKHKKAAIYGGTKQTQYGKPTTNYANPADVYAAVMADDTIQ